MKITDLASTIGCTAGSASVAVKRLEKAGLVRRERSKKDERVVTVTLGKQGVRRLDAWRGEQLASMTVLFDPFSSEEKRALRDLLTRALTASGDLPMQSPKSSSGGRR